MNEIIKIIEQVKGVCMIVQIRSSQEVYDGPLVGIFV